eukprot:TRINITY_DN36522_c0_g1_i1.p1 TRINITY_DN36522_c0_g1~~TRINITY_DN36522_c0_g1_i1.p1  ORF type:complete len:590 (+),score=64.72 TRINITY_DN36522_c0_g1_i1:76-1770(+)
MAAPERRVDPADGQLYTREQFVAEYGDEAQWDAAGGTEEDNEHARAVVGQLPPEVRRAGLERAGGREVWQTLSWLQRLRICGGGGPASNPGPNQVGERRVDPADGQRYTQLEFLEEYGAEGALRWARAAPPEEPPLPAAPDSGTGAAGAPFPSPGAGEPPRSPQTRRLPPRVSTRVQQRYQEHERPSDGWRRRFPDAGPRREHAAGRGGAGRGAPALGVPAWKQGHVVVQVVLWPVGFEVLLPDALELGALSKGYKGLKIGDPPRLLPFNEVQRYNDIRWRSFVTQLRSVDPPEELNQLSDLGSHVHLSIIDRDDHGSLWAGAAQPRTKGAAPASAAAAAAGPPTGGPLHQAPRPAWRIEPPGVPVGPDGYRYTGLDPAGVHALRRLWEGSLAPHYEARVTDWEGRLRVARNLGLATPPAPPLPPEEPRPAGAAGPTPALRRKALGIATAVGVCAGAMAVLAARRHWALRRWPPPDPQRPLPAAARLQLPGGWEGFCSLPGPVALVAANARDGAGQQVWAAGGRRWGQDTMAGAVEQARERAATTAPGAALRVLWPPYWEEFVT